MIAAITRALSLGGPTATHVTTAVAWIVGLLAVFGAVALMRVSRSDP